MKKICFVNVVDNYNDSKKSVEIIGILSLASIIKKKTNYAVDIVDFGQEYKINTFKPVYEFEQDVEKMYLRLIEDEPNIISFYTMCNNYHICIALAKIIKKRNPDIKILFGGPQATLTAESTLESMDWIDAISMGEGELSIVKTMDALLGYGVLSEVDGLVYRSNGKVRKNQNVKLIENLDELPYIDYSLIDMTDIKSVDIDAGRGCPFGCTFCSTKVFWNRKFRLKSSARILDEIKYLYYKYGIKRYTLTHDLFTANKRKVIEFCEKMIEWGEEISWGCSSRVDTLDEEMISMMSKAGCDDIYLGVETGSSNMQKMINKNLDVDKLIPTIRKLNKYKMKFVTSFIYGFPFETLEDTNATLNLIYEMYKTGMVDYKSIQLHELSFFPGTEILKIYSQHLEYENNFNSTMLHYAELPEYMKTIIRSNKDIFPHFFKYSGLSSDLDGLDKFIPILLVRLFKKFKISSQLIVNFYDNNLIELFKAYRNFDKSLIDNLSYYDTKKMTNVLTESIVGFKNFIMSGNYGLIDNKIKYIAQFEYDIIDFLHFNEDEKKVIKYPYNVYEAVNKKNVDNFNEEIEVLFSRSEKSKINVRLINRSEVAREVECIN